MRWFDREKFRALRQERGYNMASLARKCDMSPATIRHWESGRSMPSMEALSVVVAQLGVSARAVLSLPPEATLSDIRAVHLIDAKDIADELGIQVSTLYSIERGEIKLTSDKARALSIAYEMPIEKIYDAQDHARDIL